MLASGIKGMRIQLRFRVAWFCFYAAAPRMPRLLAARCAVAVLLCVKDLTTYSLFIAMSYYRQVIKLKTYIMVH
jgi:hypothetical protein